MQDIKEAHKAIAESGYVGAPGPLPTVKVVQEVSTSEAFTGECCRQSLLDIASSAVYGARQRDYGTARENHETIARLWSAVLGIDVTYQQVIQCMVCVKLARLNRSPDHKDSWVDIAGYAAVWDKAQNGE